jgi:hypothetical protein
MGILARKIVLIDTIEVHRFRVHRSGLVKERL